MPKDLPLSVQSWPQAIVHIDGDSFFAACEQALHTEYKGKPLVVGGERGIATAMSKEAKELGITRGMRNFEIKRRHPDCIIVPSDYESYSLFSMRMFNIVRRYTPTVEEYSIDECFADITGLRRPLRKTYEEIARSIKADLDRELGMTFSVGLAPTKVVAKVATGWRKPDGFTAIQAKYIHHALKRIRPGDIWGIGPQTASRLKKLDIKTALHFAQQTEECVKKHFSKPQLEIWQELRGQSVLPVETEKRTPKSINKSKTFTPPSKKREYVFSQLSKNIENACIRARRHGLVSDTVTVFLKTQDFTVRSEKLTFSLPTQAAQEIITAAKPSFGTLFQQNALYRSTGVRLSNLQPRSSTQRDLFNNHQRVERHTSIADVMDKIDRKYGKHTIYLGSSMQAITGRSNEGERTTPAKRKQDLLRGETARRRIAIPYLGTVR